MFGTKIAVIIREDLLSWQALNVTAFLIRGIVGQFPDVWSVNPIATPDISSRHTSYYRRA